MGVDDLSRSRAAHMAMASTSEDEGPEDILLVRGKDEALKQKRSEVSAVKR